MKRNYPVHPMGLFVLVPAMTMLTLPLRADQQTFRAVPLTIPTDGKPGFTLLAPDQTDIRFENKLEDRHAAVNHTLMNGSGLAAGDIDSDGRCDLYFCRLDGNNILYRNLGNFKFEDITETAGLSLPGRFSTGAVFADLDGDNDLDLITTAIGGPNGCFLNDGTGKFTDVTEKAGLNANFGSTSIALADADNDGDLDLYITNYRATRFRDEPQAAEFKPEFHIDPKFLDAGLVRFANGKPAVRDGQVLVNDGDLLVKGGTLDGKKIGRAEIPERWKGKLTIRGDSVADIPEPDLFYLNNGDATFTRIPITGPRFRDEDGKPLRNPPQDWGLSVFFRDLDNDRDPDIYVCNDFESPDRIWINDGTGHFQAAPRLAFRNTSATSMGADLADIDRDGHMDLFVVDMLSRDHRLQKIQMGVMKPTPTAIGEIENRPQNMRNTLFVNRGDATYAEIAQFAGVHASEWSWAAMFLDVDLDGFEDVLVTTGHARDAQDADAINQSKAVISDAAFIFDAQIKLKNLLLYPILQSENVAFRNRGNLTFEQAGPRWGLDAKDISHGIVAADLDNDGDLDLAINRLDAPAAIYRNNTSAPRIAVRLHGQTPNTQAIGAKITVTGQPVTQSQDVVSGGIYLSGSDPMRTFAAPDPKSAMTIEVTWRNGTRFVIPTAHPNHLYEIRQDAAASSPSTPAHVAKTIFEDVSDRIAHTHHDDPFDDFERQSLLPNRLSQLGPGIAWHDIDNDNDDDLIIAAGRGGTLAVYRNDGSGKFDRVKDPVLDKTTGRDLTTVVAWVAPDGSPAIIVGTSNFEDGEVRFNAAARYDFQKDRITRSQAVPAQLSSTGPLAMADYDGDGDLDLFLGGRTVPGKYPVPATSMLFKNTNGTFRLDLKNTNLLTDFALVSGAVFSDIDNDNDPDLILACEWGPVTVFKNDNGSFHNVTEQLGLAQYTGWWNGVNTADLDNDGRLDIIATNWGLNSKYHASPDHPLNIYYRDFDKNGSLDIVEAHYDPYMKIVVPERGLSCSSRCMPFVRKVTPTYHEYGSAGIRDIYGDQLDLAEKVQANTLRSMVFFNRGKRFEPVPLPDQAQLTPAFHVAVADFDNDGNEDLFLSQNFFSAQIETSRSDAGRGLWLKGDGTGKLTPLPGHVTGIKVYGEQRGAALADFDADGRVDLVVTQNGAQTKLYRNTTAEPGLRVRLVGPTKNPTAIGAKIRLVFGDKKGPVREIHAGAGYWSQDSTIQVLGTPTPPTAVEVRFLNGKTVTPPVPADAAEITVNHAGKLAVTRTRKTTAEK